MHKNTLEKYDLYIANPARYLPTETGLPFGEELLATRGLVHLELVLAEARHVLRIARDCGANAYLIPVEYRHPAISLQEARALALRQHTEMIRAGKRMADLDDGFDDFLWWTFCADDMEAKEDDMIPGRICISIDKLDGHVRSPDEFGQWLQLCAT